MAEQITEIIRLYLGRGLQAEPFPETGEKLEVSVDLYDLGVDYAADWVEWAGAAGGGPAADTAVWMPLTTVSAGVPELVWGGDDGLIPTLIPLS